MPRPRKPLTAVKTEGRETKDKGRFAGRNEHDASGPLGDPPPYIIDTDTCKAKSAWHALEVEIPWLTKRDRSLIEMACMVRGEIIAGGFPGVQKMNLLRQMLGQMGATPADATKVGAPEKDDDDEEEDIFSKPRARAKK